MKAKFVLMPGTCALFSSFSVTPPVTFPCSNMDGRDGQNTTNETDRAGLRTLLEHISSAAFHNSQERLNEVNPNIIRKWVRKWTLRLKSLSHSDLSSIPPTQVQPDNPDQVIIEVFKWLFDRSSPSPIMWIHHDDRAQTPFWSQTIASILDELGQLSGSFFSSTANDGINITRVIPTLAFELAHNIPDTRSLIAQTVLQGGSIFDLQAKPQIKRLILDPLLFASRSRNMGTSTPNVFIIHGLEELDDTNHSQSSLLYAFSEGLELLATNNIQCRLILVGRYSSYIERCVSGDDLRQRVLQHPITMRVSLGEEEGVRPMEKGSRKREVPWHLMNTLKGHSSSVRRIAFSPDGSRLASGSFDKTVRLWDGKSGSLVATLEGHTADIYDVAFSADGSRLASGCNDNTVRLWDGKTGNFISILEGHPSYVQCVAFSPDSSKLASGSCDGTIRLWAARTGSYIAALGGHTADVFDVAFSPDGSIIASGSEDKTVRLWEAKTNSHIATLKGHSNRIYAITFSPDGSKLASGSFDNTLRLWDVKMGSLIATLESHTSHVVNVKFSPDGSILASGSKDKTVRLWDSKTGSLVSTLTGHSNEVWAVAFSPNGMTLASGDDKTLRLWDVETRSLIATLEGHTSWIVSAAFSPDGDSLATASYDNTVRLWH